MRSERDVEIALCVFRESNDAMIVFDPKDWSVVDLNPAALRLSKLDRKPALASKLQDLLSAPEPDDFRKFVDACHVTGYFHAKEGYFLSRRDARRSR